MPNFQKNADWFGDTYEISRRTESSRRSSVSGRRARSSVTRGARWWEVAVVYLLAVAAYAVLVREVQAPYKFVDEALYGGTARSIAFGGGAAWRGGATGIHSLYPYAIAPAWLVFDAAHA